MCRVLGMGLLEHVSKCVALLVVEGWPCPGTLLVFQ